MSPVPQWSPTDPGAPTEFIEKTGYLTKLSKDLDVFGAEKWQLRYFVLNNTALSYYGKAGDAEPKGVIPLLQGQVFLKIKGEPRRKDCFNKRTGGTVKLLTASLGSIRNEYDGTLSRDCISLYKPTNVMNMIDKASYYC